MTSSTLARPVGGTDRAMRDALYAPSGMLDRVALRTAIHEASSA